MKKRIWSILLALCMLLSLLPFGTVTASAADVSDLSYRIENDTVTITGCSYEASGALVIPATIEGYPVTSIETSAFQGCSSLSSITIPDSVTSIGDYVFNVCGSLTSIEVAAGNPSFRSMEGVLFSKDGKTLIRYPEGKSGSYQIPQGVTSIGARAFFDCSSLTSVRIPYGVTSMGTQAFFECSSLASATVPGSVTSIGAGAFSRCASLQEIMLAEGIGEIQFGAFEDCSSLKRVELPNSVTTIGYDAFLNSGLTSVTIPASVTSIGAGAFSACKDLTAIQVEEGSPAYCSVGGGLLSKDQKTMVCYPAGKTGAYAIPESVTVVESAAFSKCTGLTGVTIPNGVTVIDQNTFYGCTGLTGVTIPDGVTEIDVGAFSGCTGLTDITIPEGVTLVSNSAFYGCENLKDVTLPVSLTTISYDAFLLCGIKDIWYAGTKEQWDAITIRDAYGDFFRTGAAEHYNAHTHTDLTAVAAVAPSCTKDGTEAYWKCNTCGKLFSDVLGKYEIAAPAAVPAAGHKWDSGKVTKEPTETAEGAKTVTCTVCGETETQTIPKLAHTHDLTAVAAVAATCTKDGTGAYWKCNTCGKLFSDVLGKYEIAAPAAVPAAGHKWDSGEVIKEPTETAEGVKTFTCTVCGEKRTEAIAKLTPKPVENPFTDVPADQYYYEPVLWAVNHDPQITNGTGDNTFSPDATCTRGQIVTFLWRAKGCPEPKSTVNPFTDVKESDYFYKAILWANENDVTNGTGDGTFSPEAPCTRAHVVTFLWRAEGKPAAGGSNPFRDVPAGQYYTEAVLWAVNHDPQITNGTGPDTFGPNDPCTRGQIVTFLYRDMK